MHLLLKWRSLVLALVAAFVPLAPAAATLLEVEGSGAVPGFHSSEQLGRYLTLHMAEAQSAGWRFEPAAAGDAPASGRVKWRFKLDPYAGGEVRSFVPSHMDDETFGVHRPITIEARLYRNGEYQTLVKEKAIIQGGPDDPDLAAAVASLTQNLLRPSGAYRSIIAASTRVSRWGSASPAAAQFAITSSAVPPTDQSHCGCRLLERGPSAYEFPLFAGKTNDRWPLTRLARKVAG